MLTIISPAKKMDFDSPWPRLDVTVPDFLSHSRRLNRILREYPALDLMELMNVSRDIAALNVERNQKWRTPFNKKNAKPAVLVFAGEVYRALDATTMKTADLKFSQSHLRILSGLYGLLRPLDLIQPYRLEMGTKLPNEAGNNLYAFWGHQLTDKINAELAAHRCKILINLASNEYFKSLKPTLISGDIITPAFKEKRNGKYAMIAIYAKKARGLMSRYIIKNRITQAQDLRSFDLGGYQFNVSLSSDSDWVFTRG